MRERRPRYFEPVRVDGRQAQVFKVDYQDERVQVRFKDAKGGMKALELDRFYDNWDGRRWDIPDDRGMYTDYDDRVDVEILFDLCLAGEHPTHPDYVCDTREKKIARLKFLASYMAKDNLRHIIVASMERGEDDPGLD